MKALGWHFLPWSDHYIELYSSHIDHQYQEVRGAVADNLRQLSELRFHPSFGGTDEFLRSVVGNPGAISDRLLGVDETYERRIDDVAKKLEGMRSVRQSAAQGTQQYDRAAMTVITWIWSGISDFRIATSFPFITKLFTEFFRMQEILDNEVRPVGGVLRSIR